MDTTIAPPLISQNTSGHRGGSDPAENIAVLRTAIRGGALGAPWHAETVRRLLLLIAGRNALIARLAHGQVEAERERDAALAEACALRGALRQAWAERDEAQRSCVAARREARGLARAMDGMQAHVDEVNAAWRAASERSARDAELNATLHAQLDDLLAPAVPSRGRRGRRP